METKCRGNILYFVMRVGINTINLFSGGERQCDNLANKLTLETKCVYDGVHPALHDLLAKAVLGDAEHDGEAEDGELWVEGNHSSGEWSVEWS